MDPNLMQSFWLVSVTGGFRFHLSLVKKTQPISTAINPIATIHQNHAIPCGRLDFGPNSRRVNSS